MSTVSTDSPEAPVAVTSEAVERQSATEDPTAGIDLADPSLYFSRELSWLD